MVTLLNSIIKNKKMLITVNMLFNVRLLRVSHISLHDTRNGFGMYILFLFLTTINSSDKKIKKNGKDN